MNLLASPLTTDLYQLTMLNAYYAHGMGEAAVFELFVRKLPRERNFMMAAGLEQALEFLEHLRFAPEELEWIEASGKFSRGFAAHLERLRFTGEVHAVPEGTIFFSDEPVLRVTAPLPEAQLVETRLINLVHFETLVATKAARSVIAAPGKLLVDFGLRRAHGAEAGLLAARAAYIAGYSGTATVAAAERMGIPVFGTMAHSFVEAHDDEAAAFQRFAESCPQNVVLLIDTYDTEAGARKVVELAPRLASRGIRVRGVRLDSGDLGALSRSVRRILDDGGLAEATIFASGNIDEYRIRDLIAGGAPIDGFGVGTSLVTSSDAPYLDAVYKLQEYAGKARRKRSTGKATWPGRKQVFRHFDRAGRFEHDVITVDGEERQGEPLLVPVMRNGKRLDAPESLAAIRERAASQLAKLPARLRALESAATQYRVEIAPALRKLAAQVDHAAEEVPALCK
jgi:nicotinate phosphoribosyltransferase